MITELKEKMRNGAVRFTFTKKDGTTRQAHGTLNAETAGDTYIIPSGKGTEKVGTTAYWDLDKEAWRSFNNDLLISLD